MRVQVTQLQVGYLRLNARFGLQADPGELQLQPVEKSIAPQSRPPRLQDPKPASPAGRNQPRSRVPETVGVRLYGRRESAEREYQLVCVPQNARWQYSHYRRHEYRQPLLALGHQRPLLP